MKPHPKRACEPISFTDLSMVKLPSLVQPANALSHILLQLTVAMPKFGQLANAPMPISPSMSISAVVIFSLFSIAVESMLPVPVTVSVPSSDSTYFIGRETTSCISSDILTNSSAIALKLKGFPSALVIWKGVSDLPYDQGELKNN